MTCIQARVIASTVTDWHLVLTSENYITRRLVSLEQHSTCVLYVPTSLCHYARKFSRHGQILLAHRTPEKRVVAEEESQTQGCPGEKMRLSNRMFHC